MTYLHSRDKSTEDLTPLEARLKRDELQSSLSNVYKGAPRTISKAYRNATKALKKNEELTFSDDEIDILLPKELRLNSRNKNT